MSTRTNRSNFPTPSQLWGTGSLLMPMPMPIVIVIIIAIAIAIAEEA